MSEIAVIDGIDCVDGVQVERTSSGRIRYLRIDLDTHPSIVSILQEIGFVNDYFYKDQQSPCELDPDMIHNSQILKDFQKQIKQMVSRRVDENIAHTHPAEIVEKIKNDLYYNIDLIFKNIANGLTSMKNVLNDSTFFRYDLGRDYRGEWANILQKDIASMIEDFNTKK